MIYRNRLLAFFLALLLPTAAFSETNDSAMVIRIMTVVICQQDGFLQYLLEPYLQKHNIRVEYTTGHHREVAQAVRNGEIDIAITHTKVKVMQKLASLGKLVYGQVIFANPKAFLGPTGDPAGISGLPDPVQAMQQIQNAGFCYVINPHGELEKLQKSLLESATANNKCVIADAQGTESALDLAFEKSAYTMWGLHPYAAKSEHRLQPVVIPDDRLLQNLGAWVVSGSDVEAEARDLVDYLASEEVKEHLAGFRLKTYEAVQPWWPPVDKK